MTCRSLMLAVFTLTALGTMLHGQAAWAQATPHVSTKLALGLTTYKSKMLQSNDTGFTLGYGFGVSSGGEHGMSMNLEREQSTIAFQLNNGSLALETQDVDLTYRWGPDYLGAIFANTSWYAKSPPDADANSYLDQDAVAQDYLDVLATGYGARTGLIIPMARRNSLYLDVRYATSSKVQQTIPEETSTAGISGTSPALGRKVGLGARMSIDLGASLALTRDILSLIAGYRYRTYAVTIESNTFSELHTSTYIGLQAGWTF